MRRIMVWDLATRVFHWLLVAAVALAYLMSSGRPSGTTFLIHVTCGYLIVLLLLFRFAWGVVGGEHARFRNFVRRPRAALDYVRALLAGGAPRFIGHNPAGAAMIVLLLATLVLLVVTGLLAEDITGGTGPLTGVLSPTATREVGAVHQLLGNAILILAGIHVAGVIGESLLHRENLAVAMVTGRKPARRKEERDARRAPAWRAVLLLAMIAVLGVAMAAATTIPPARGVVTPHGRAAPTGG